MFASCAAAVAAATEEHKRFYESIKNLPDEDRQKAISDRKSFQDEMHKIHEECEDNRKDNTTCIGLAALAFIFGISLG